MVIHVGTSFSPFSVTTRWWLVPQSKEDNLSSFSVLVLCKTIKLPLSVSQHNKYSTHFNVSVISLESASFQMKIWLLSCKFNFIGESFDLNYSKFVLCTKFYLAQTITSVCYVFFTNKVS